MKMKTNVYAKLAPLAALFIAATLAVAGCGSSSSGGGTGGTKGGAGGSGSGGASGTGGAGTGGAGTGGASGTGGAGTGGAGTGGSDGAVMDTPAGETGGDAPAGGAMAQATITALTGGTITGTVTFVAVADGVQVTYALDNCPAGIHPTHIHAGAACGADGQLAMMHWDSPRGDNIGSGTGQITCTADMKGVMTYTRPSTPADARWTIGAPAASNVVGHTLMVHGLGVGSQVRDGCGPIVMK